MNALPSLDALVRRAREARAPGEVRPAGASARLRAAVWRKIDARAARAREAELRPLLYVMGGAAVAAAAAAAVAALSWDTAWWSGETVSFVQDLFL